MDIRIDKKEKTPVYLQIVWQIRAGIRCGELPENGALPSERAFDDLFERAEGESRYSLGSGIAQPDVYDREKLAREGRECFLALHESVRREYAGDAPVTVAPADMTFSGEMRLDAGNCPIRLFQAEAPHTDDSTLIHVPGERALLLGDAAGGVFPTWEKDPALARKLADTIEAVDADICLESHWTPDTKRGTIDDLLKDDD